LELQKWTPKGPFSMSPLAPLAHLDPYLNIQLVLWVLHYKEYLEGTKWIPLHIFTTLPTPKPY